MIDIRAQERIEKAITAAEMISRAELVAVIARRAGDYQSIGIILSTIGAFLAGFIVWAFVPWSDTSNVLLAEFLTFIVLFGLLALTPLRDRLTPSTILRQNAGRLARAVFLEQGLAETPERNAVMLYVSQAERHVEIIADAAINSKVDQVEWQKIVDNFSSHARAGKIEVGFLKAIESLSSLLSKHFPVTGPRLNTLSNRVIHL